MASGQRKLSQNTQEESNNACACSNNIIFSDTVNKFSEYQDYDPSDSHSNFPNNPYMPNFAQINDLLEDNDEDVRVLNNQDAKLAINYAAEDAGSLTSGQMMHNSTNQANMNGINLLPSNHLQPQRGQSYCDNTHQQLQYHSKHPDAVSGGVGPNFISHDKNINNSVTPIIARNTTFCQNSLQPALPGGNDRHQSMDSRQPLQQTTQIDGNAPAHMMIGDVHYFNEMNKLNPGGSGMSTSRKSVYSNKELQKNNFFKEE